MNVTINGNHEALTLGDLYRAHGAGCKFITRTAWVGSPESGGAVALNPQVYIIPPVVIPDMDHNTLSCFSIHEGKNFKLRMSTHVVKVDITDITIKVTKEYK